MKLSSALIAAGLLVEIATLYRSHPLTILAFLAIDANLQKVGGYVRNRTVTLVFFVGDRYFGVVTAFVPREAAGDYEFTSSLPERLFVDVMPELGLTLARD